MNVDFISFQTVRKKALHSDYICFTHSMYSNYYYFIVEPLSSYWKLGWQNNEIFWMEGSLHSKKNINSFVLSSKGLQMKWENKKQKNWEFGSSWPRVWKCHSHKCVCKENQLNDLFVTVSRQQIETERIRKR